MMTKQRKKTSGWANYPLTIGCEFFPENTDELRRILAERQEITPRGNGRSYGDSSLGNNMISSQKLNSILELNGELGTVKCQSGVLLKHLLNFLLPKGFWLPVVPGTQLITVGGAIASDIHGKNHFLAGNFSQHIVGLKLMISTGEIVECSSKSNADLFWATCGGMGLTGFILESTLKLEKINSAYLQKLDVRANNLTELFQEFKKCIHAEYKVAWIDCFAKGSNTGKSIFTYALTYSCNNPTLKERNSYNLNIPFYFPSFLLCNFIIQVFNIIKWKFLAIDSKPRITHLQNFLFPLDSVLNWNRLYGKRGFVQYQFVLPTDKAKIGIRDVLCELQKSEDKCLLATLKEFGKSSDQSLLGFPLEGFTLALDFKMTNTLLSFLDKLDQIVLKNGGRIYLTKDARMDKCMMTGYPKLNQFKEVVKRFNPDSKFTSEQVKRIGYTI